MEIRSESDELFEEKIQELDCDIHKFDPTPKLITKNISCTGKENDFESLTVNEIFELGRSQARDQPLHQSACTPLSHVPDASNVPIMNTASWRHQNRIITGTYVIMEDTLGSKRSTSNMGSQPELQKKRKTISQGARTIQRYWRRLNPSLARIDEYNMLKLSGTWEPTNRRPAHRYGVDKRSLHLVLSRNMDG